MKHVRVMLSAGGREGEIHPMYDVMANADFVDRATALQWNVTDTELGILHYVEGDVDAFRDAVETIPEVLDYDIVRAGDDAFYAYIRDEANDRVRELFGLVSKGPAVVIPPIEYAPDGTVSYSVFGPPAVIQAAIDAIPAPFDVSVTEVTGMAGAPVAAETRLTDRQREALEAALEMGYYDVPRAADHEAVADALACAPSTAAEHLRKAEAALVRAFLET